MRYILIGLLCASAWGQSPVVVTGPLKMATAEDWTGDLTVSWPSMKCGTTPVVKGSRTFRVTNGVVPTIQVYPTASCGNNRYTINYTGGTIAYWTIPTTPSSQSILSIETLTTPALPVIPPFAIGQVSGLQAALDSLALLIPGSAVPSVFGRTGPITAQSGDYSSHYEAKDATILKSGGSYSDPSWLTLSIAKTTGLQSALDLKAPLDSPTFTGSVTLPVTGSAQCLHVDAAGLVSGSGADCGTGTGGGSTIIPGIGTTISGSDPITISSDPLVQTFYSVGSDVPTGVCEDVRFHFRTGTNTVYSCDGDTWTLLGSMAHVHAASEITSGTLSADRLPIPATNALGGVMRNAGGVGEFVNGINSSGQLTYATPAGGSGSTTGLYSGTLNFGAIPDLGCASLTLTATGLTTGKTLALSLPSALETGLIGTAFASAADTATVRLCNVSGASIDPASATFAVRDMDALGYLTASATINFGSIVDGSCAASTVTLSGAASGDNVAAGWPAALEAGLTGSMFVSATDTVAVRVCNFSGAAVDPASATFKAAITR